MLALFSFSLLQSKLPSTPLRLICPGKNLPKKLSRFSRLRMRINSRIICFAFPPSFSYFLRDVASTRPSSGARDTLYIMQVTESKRRKRKHLPRHLFLTIFITGALEVTKFRSIIDI